MTAPAAHPPTAIRSGAAIKRSAELTTYLRAVAAREPDPGLRCPDQLAARLIGPEWQRMLRLPLWIVRSRLEHNLPGSYFHVLARTRHIDRLLTEALWAGIEQLVILGAGFDSRAVRFQDQLSSVRVFEVDSPGNQVVKKERLRAALGSLPGHIIFMPVDFNHQPLSEALISGGYQTSLKTFFIWEGVSYYLLPAAVDAVLKFAAVGCGVGSSIVFDYALESFVRGDYHSRRAARMGAVYATSSEPFVSGVPDGKSGAFLEERGLRLISDLGPAELEQQYLRRKNGSLSGRPSDFLRIALACNG